MRIAFLDLDHTLLMADSNQLWMAYLHAQRWIGDAEVAAHEQFIADYANGVLDFARLQVFRDGIDASLPAERLQACQWAFQQELLFPAIAPKAPRLLRELKDQCFVTVLVSATRPSLVEPVARHLSVDHVIAPCFGAQKVQHVEAWLAAQGHRLSMLADSWFYSDSQNDLPLLKAVRNPVAVDPDPQLAQVARQHDWPVISLRGPALE